MFWTGHGVGWEGMVAVDGVSYEYLGVGSQVLPRLAHLKPAVPKEVSYDSQYSNFTFTAGSVEITASFLSAVTPKDNCRSSIPLSYLTTSVRSLDNKTHRVQFYSDINAAWVAFEGDKEIRWKMTQGSSPVNSTNRFRKGWNSTSSAAAGSAVYSWTMQLGRPYFFGEENDFPQWGNFSYSSSAMGARSFTYQSGYAYDLRYSFVNETTLENTVDPDFRGSGNREPVFAFSHDVGNVTEASVRYTIGMVQTPVIRYLNHGGVTALRPWWERCYGDMFSMIRFHWDDFDQVRKMADEFESKLKADISDYHKEASSKTSGTHAHSDATNLPNSTIEAVEKRSPTDNTTYIFDPSNGSGYLDPKTFDGVAVPGASEAQAHYAIVAISARQVMGSHVYAVPPPSSANTSEPLVFQKEISSSGNVNTVDVLYPASPFFLYANPELLRYSLEPLFENQEGTFYPNGYSMHDIGGNFPNATGHVEGHDEYMPIEESGNLILMSYAYFKFSGDSAWVARHYPMLTQFAQYLIEFSLVPSGQLSTDDFAGTLANQTNLAIKGIIGLQAMAEMAKATGRAADEAQFRRTAGDYYRQWERFAVDPSGTHTTLAYEWRSSWGLLYNIYFDRALGLGVVRPDIYDMQSRWYPHVSQVFGVPLDNRHHYTKSDWMMWTAATCAPATRRMLVTSLAYWLNNTVTSLPFTDLYETMATGDYPRVPNNIEFKARPVAGGHFALLAMEAADRLGKRDIGPGSR